MLTTTLYCSTVMSNHPIGILNTSLFVSTKIIKILSLEFILHIAKNMFLFTENIEYIYFCGENVQYSIYYDSYSYNYLFPSHAIRYILYVRMYYVRIMRFTRG